MNLNFKLKKYHIDLLKDIEEEINKMGEKKNQNKFKMMLEFHKKINNNLLNKYNNNINIWDLDNLIKLSEKDNNMEEKYKIENIKKIIEKKNKIIIYNIIKTNKWKEFIINKYNQILKKSNKENINIDEENKKKLYNELSKLIINNILEYKYYWNCCNKIVIINNILNKIKVININDLDLKNKIEDEFINKYLNMYN